MNQGRIWCVVNPTVGLPLFLGGVAVISLTVHFAVMNNAAWFKDFHNGVPMTKAASAEKTVVPNADLAKAGAPAVTVEIAPAPAANGDAEASFIVKIKPKDPLPNPS
jgi:light-harvesting protein B-800-850 alpha chain